MGDGVDGEIEVLLEVVDDDCVVMGEVFVELGVKVVGVGVVFVGGVYGEGLFDLVLEIVGFWIVDCEEICLVVELC